MGVGVCVYEEGRKSNDVVTSQLQRTTTDWSFLVC